MEGYISEIRMFAGNFAPLYWASCNGQLMSIAENTALFSLIGTIYGGDGQVTFGLPNFQGRTAVGTGTGGGLPTYDLGEMAGNSTTTMTSANLPAHNHVAMLKTSSSNGTTASPVGAYPATGTGATSDGKTIQMAVAAAAGDGSQMTGVSLQPAGNSAPFSVQNPYLALNFIICIEGIFPSRN